MNYLLKNDGTLVVNQKEYNLSELVAMKGFDQMNPHHPEGDLMSHTQQVINYLKDDVDLWFCGVFHDTGKVTSWQWHKNGVHKTFYGHEKASVKILDALPEEVKQLFNFDKVRWIISNHIKILQIDKMREFKREAMQSNIWFEDLVRFHKADMEGRKSEN